MKSTIGHNLINKTEELIFQITIHLSHLCLCQLTVYVVLQ